MSNDALADVFLILYGKVSVFVWDLGFRFLDLDHLLEIKFFLLGLWVTNHSIPSTDVTLWSINWVHWCALAFLILDEFNRDGIGILGNGWESYDIKILSHFYILVEILVDLGIGKAQGLKVRTSTSEYSNGHNHICQSQDHDDHDEKRYNKSHPDHHNDHHVPYGFCVH
jgi:hypothetical protein